MKKSLKSNKKFILIASNPFNFEQNDKFLEMDIEALKLSGLSFDEYLILDNRNKTKIPEVLKDSSLIFLCGGNTYIQNQCLYHLSHIFHIHLQCFELIPFLIHNCS